jgi:hypothetical protein
MTTTLQSHTESLLRLTNGDVSLEKAKCLVYCLRSKCGIRLPSRTQSEKTKIVCRPSGGENLSKKQVGTDKIEEES